MRADSVRSTDVSPPPPPPPLPPAPTAERHVAHRVAPGETMTDVARRFSTDADTLHSANPDLPDRDRLDAGQVLQVPIGEGYGREPQFTQAHQGQTLLDLARQVAVPVPLLVDANRHALTDLNADPGAIDMRQQIWFPGGYLVQSPAPQPLTPLDQAVQNTDAAAARAVTAQQAYEEMSASTYGNGAAVPFLAQNAADAQRGLDTAVQAEIELRVSRSLRPGYGATEADYAAAEAAVQQRTPGDPAAQQAVMDAVMDAVTDAVARVNTTRQAQTIVNRAGVAGDPAAALRVLSEGHATASPAVQQALLLNPGAQQVIADAAAWALAPLQAGPGDSGFGQQAPGMQTMERLDQLTAEVSPEIAARLMAAAAPVIDAAMTNYFEQIGISPFGQAGVEHLTHALGRMAGTPLGDAVIDRYARMGIWDRSGIANAIAQGASPAYAMALARQPGVDVAMVMDSVYAGMDIFRAQVADHTAAYGKQMEELAWLVTSHGGSMTPEQLDLAIADYTAEKGPDWQQQTAALKQQLADDGERLLSQLQALQTLPPELSGESGRVDELIAETLNDTHAQLAITTALQGNPALTAGAAGQQLLGFFTSTGFASNAKLSDQARKLVSEVATAHVQSTLLARVGEFDPADPASVQRATAAIHSLRSPELARAWGVSEDALDSALVKLSQTMPVAGETAELAAARLRSFDMALGGIKGFDKTTLAGQLLRGAGLALAGVGVLASAERAGLDPSLRNNLRVLVDAAGLGQKGAELLAGLTKADSQSTLGRLGGSAASKFLGVVTAAMDVWSAAEAFGNGDIPSGVLYGVGAGGGLLAAFGSGSLAGPIGIGLVVVSVVGLAIWNGQKEANKNEPDSDGGTSMRFLQHAGFTEAAARELCDQTGDGVSPVPVFERYAELKGVDLSDNADRQRFVDWINAMPPERLAVLRDNLHNTLDELEGDAGRLQATADDDEWVLADTPQRPWFAMSGVAEPESAAQIDAVLEVLELPLLTR